MKFYIYISQSKRLIPKINNLSSSASGRFFAIVLCRGFEENKTLNEENIFQKISKKICDQKKDFSAIFSFYPDCFLERRPKSNNLPSPQIVPALNSKREKG